MHFSEWLSISVERYVLNYAFKFGAPLSCRFSFRSRNILRSRKTTRFSLGWFLDMARKTPNQASRRRVNEMHNLRDVNGNPTRLSASMISTPRAKQSRTRPSSSSVNTTTVTARNTRLSTNLDTTPSFSDSSNEDSSLTSASSSSTPIVPTRSRGENDSTRINRVLVPLLQLADGRERPNDGAGESLPAVVLQQLNTFMARQERFNERLEQKIVAFEEQSQNGWEKKASRRLPKALTVRISVFLSLLFTSSGTK